MADTGTDAEPTMEEILASIRNIISEDDEGGTKEAVAEEPAPEAEPEPEMAAPEPEPEPEPEMAATEPEPEPEMAAPEPEPEDDVLELTETVGAEEPAVEEDGDLIIFDESHEPEPAPPAEPADDISEEELLSDATAAATASTLGALASSIRVADKDGQTLEGVMRELLRPLLKDWLDANLPAIVEAKVEAAIDKVVRQTRA